MECRREGVKETSYSLPVFRRRATGVADKQNAAPPGQPRSGPPGRAANDKAGGFYQAFSKTKRAKQDVADSSAAVALQMLSTGPVTVRLPAENSSSME